MKFPSYRIQSNYYQKVGALFGICGSVISITLWVFIIFFAKGQHTSKLYIITQILPGIVGIVSSVLKKVWPLIIVFLILLPLGLYMTMTPSIFRYFGLALAFYLFSIILLLAGNRIRKKKLPEFEDQDIVIEQNNDDIH
ncbi:MULTISPECIES: hypothetical protein [Dehalobacter]|jgi:asparagine N-glycosylation enzyme membrane subunit Stt3|uniref:Uncharacterized protein n=2 Tax=Dehalobacter restrictus TaxID=55583 RepID=A0A857DH04_9FIRM|nr:MULTISPECIES: hypothetical protein [Dehalobacter]AHF09594.1 hypothetical protein DEHRE_05440 [Dehalobacter restrictus DSM 9455]MCG1026579.1 hypothetical protein [Dehalobacter sp.]MDJ0304368.1 hypothetical protein [Dehalobacter sp.]OCZ54935.1 hypothetical protein A7D23_04115 [Dehalobacter sp. TeCB1]QHA00187.1 hypothetical protein GQ588_05755 [Dehalobacter restrictus]